MTSIFSETPILRAFLIVWSTHAAASSEPLRHGCAKRLASDALSRATGFVETSSLVAVLGGGALDWGPCLRTNTKLLACSHTLVLLASVFEYIGVYNSIVDSCVSRTTDSTPL